MDKYTGIVKYLGKICPIFKDPDQYLKLATDFTFRMDASDNMYELKPMNIELIYNRNLVLIISDDIIATNVNIENILREYFIYRNCISNISKKYRCSESFIYETLLRYNEYSIEYLLHNIFNMNSNARPKFQLDN